MRYRIGVDVMASATRSVRLVARLAAAIGAALATLAAVGVAVQAPTAAQEDGSLPLATFVVKNTGRDINTADTGRGINTAASNRETGRGINTADTGRGINTTG